MQLFLCLCLAFVGVAHSMERLMYIAAEEVVWDYAPSGYNNYDNTTIDTGNAEVFLSNTPAWIGGKYKKAQYFQYTDITFTKKIPTPTWQGNLGPTIRAEVGDTIKIVFKNKATLPYSMHPHGVKYTQAMEGVNFKFSTGRGGGVLPNQSFVYNWEVPERAGPGEADNGNAILWMYHSHHDEIADVYSGLVGPLIVYKKGTLSEEGAPKDVDKEFILFYQVTNENGSHYLADNCKTYGCQEDDVDFEESNLMHGMNGRLYANLEGLEMEVGEQTRWFVAAFGTEVDMHGSHWHGNVLDFNLHHTDVIDLLPGTFATAYMRPDAAGVWLVHCHVNDHISAGMMAYYTVNEKKA